MKLRYEKGDRLSIVPVESMPEDTPENVKALAGKYVVINKMPTVGDIYTAIAEDGNEYTLPEQYFNMSVLLDFMDAAYKLSQDTSHELLGMRAVGRLEKQGLKKSEFFPNNRQCLLVAAVPSDMVQDYLRRLKGFEKKLDTK